MAYLRFEQEGSIGESLALLQRAANCYDAHDLVGTVAEGWLQLDIGIINLAGDRLAEAERAFERCRELLVQDRGPEHPDVSRPVRELAMVALRRGELGEAERLARQAVTLCEGSSSEYIGARAQTVLAQVLLVAHRLDEASDLLDSTGTRFFDTVGGQHIRIAERQALLVELHLRLREFGTAELIAGRCEAMRRELLREDHWAILEARLQRQRARIGLGQLESVASELREIGEAAGRRVGPDHLLVIQVTSALLDLATAVQDASLRETCAARLADLQERRAERLRGKE